MICCAPMNKGPGAKKQASLSSFFNVPPPRGARVPSPPAPVQKKRAKRPSAHSDDDDDVEIYESSSESRQGSPSPARELPSAPATGAASLLFAPEPRVLREAPEIRAQLEAAGVKLPANVPARATTEPEFTYDAKLHSAWAKRVQLQGRSTAEDGDEAGLDSVLAQCTKRPGVKYTPLELQFLAVKEKHPDVVLFVECGYKFKFFASDAVVASRVLGIMCLVDKNFFVASVPVGRLEIHMERLVVAGYKAGVVRQTETAALKQGTGSKGLFARDLTDVYTTATFVGDAVVTHSAEPSYMMCVLEGSADNTTTVVAVSLRTSDLIYDVFVDNAVRSHLETRLEHLRPVELVLPVELADPAQPQSTTASSAKRPKVDAAPPALLSITSANLLREWVRRAQGPLAVRSTCVPFDDGLAARKWVRETFPERAGPLLSALDTLPDSVAVALAALGRYLDTFDLERAITLVESMRKWTLPARSMLLSADTLRNLDVFVNTSTGVGGAGTLLHHMDRTSSPMGRRLLRAWLGSPLQVAAEVEARLDAVQALRHLFLACGVACLSAKTADASMPPLVALLRLLGASGDLEQDIAAVYYRRCKPAKFLATLAAFKALLAATDAFLASAERQGASVLVLGLLRTVHESALLPLVESCLAVVDATAAQSSDWANLFVGSLDEPTAQPVPMGAGQAPLATINEARAGAAKCERDLQAHLHDIRRTLGIASLNYLSLSGREYLVEVSRTDKAALARVPSDWVAEQHTKAKMRFQTPTARELLQRLCMYREATVLLAKRKWAALLDDFSARYASFRAAVHALATLDVLASLALLSCDAGYVRPSFCSEARVLDLQQVRHPVAEALLPPGVSFIGNDCQLGSAGTEVLIVTGPNMGGKSTYIRSVALAVIMAQVGCFVPAVRARLSIFDAVYTRMGAEDDLAAGRSTFFTELLSTSAILESATSSSLVVIDELGRGTST